MAVLPTTEELLCMPARLLAAYSVRNVCRIRPLFLEAKETDHYEAHLQSIDKALMLSMNWANGIEVDDNEVEKTIRNCFSAGGVNEKVNEAAEAVANSAACTLAILSRNHHEKHFKSDLESLFNDYRYYTAHMACHISDECMFGALLANQDYKNKGASHPDSIAYFNFTKTPANKDFKKLLSLNLSEEDVIDASENGPLGSYWLDEEPDWYRILNSQIDPLLNN